MASSLLKELKAEAAARLAEWLTPKGYAPSKSNWGPSMLRPLSWGWVRIIVRIGDDRYTCDECPFSLQLEIRDERTALLENHYRVSRFVDKPPREGFRTHEYAPSVVVDGTFRIGDAKLVSKVENVADALRALRGTNGDRLVEIVGTWTERPLFVQFVIRQARGSAAADKMPADWAFLSVLAADAGDLDAATHFSSRADEAIRRHDAVGGNRWQATEAKRILETPPPAP